MSSKNQPFIRINRTDLVTADIHRPSRIRLEAMYFDRVQAVALHDAFKVGNCVFVRRICITNPSVEVTYSPVWATGCTRGVVGDEINPLIHVSSIHPPVTGSYAISVSKI